MKKTKKFNFKTYCVNLLRRGFFRSKLRYDVIREHRFLSRSFKTARLVFFLKCKKCKNAYYQNEIVVDHIKPVVDIKKGYEGLDVYAKRLFCDMKNLQILCKACHKKKTIRENKRRK